MSTTTYPAFHTLNHPEPESLSMPDQTINAYPSSDEAAWHDNLMTTLLFEQFLTLSAQYDDMTSAPIANIPSIIQQTIPVEEPPLPTPTHQLTVPGRSKHTHPRVLHACDHCRYRKTKCSGEQPLCMSCKKRGKLCTWTPIKIVKNRHSRKRGEMQPLYHAHIQGAPTGEQPYFVAQMPPYPNIVRTGIYGGVPLAPAMQGQIVNTPSSELLAGQVLTVDSGCSDPGVSNLSQVWIPLPSSTPPSFSNVPPHELPFRAHKRPRKYCNPPVTTSFTLVQSAAGKYGHPGYATRSSVPV